MEWQYPVVRHFLLCRRPFPIDANYHQLMLRVLFALRPTVPYPFRLSELSCFVQLSDASGAFEFAVEIARTGEQPAIAFAEESDFTFPDRGGVFSFTRVFENVPFREAGLYEGRLFARLLRDPGGNSVHGQPRRLLATEPLLMEAFV